MQYLFIILRIITSGYYDQRDQIRGAAVSIAGNIVEGEASSTDKNDIHYFYIARASAAEVFTQAIIAFEIGYLSKEDFIQIESTTDNISKMLITLIKSKL